jgi:membrane protease YdiL (CAAX protease family)
MEATEDHPSAKAGSPKGRVLRIAETVLFVALWTTLGWVLHLKPESYLLLGIPLTLVFQVLIARKHVVALWVRDARTFQLDWRGVAVAAGLAIAPIWFLVRQMREGKWISSGWAAAGMVGAVLAAFSIRQFSRSAVVPLLSCLATAGVIGILFILAGALVRRVINPAAAPPPGPVAVLVPLIREFLILFPTCFAVEEVTFRGAVDAHVHHPGEKYGVASALLVSALWGLWHLPVVPRSAPVLASGAILVVVHSATGVFLSTYWRRSGNLVVPAATHALIDAARNAILSAGG